MECSVTISGQRKFLIQTITADFRALYDVSTAAGYLTRLKTFIKYGMDNPQIASRYYAKVFDSTIVQTIAKAV